MIRASACMGNPPHTGIRKHMQYHIPSIVCDQRRWSFSASGSIFAR